MAYHQTTSAEAIWSMLRNVCRAGHLRSMARASLDWRFSRERHERIVAIDVHQLLDQASEIRLFGGGGAWGETPVADLIALAALVGSRRVRRAFEFGTFTGNGTLHIAANAPRDCEVFTLDLPPGVRDVTSNLHWESGIDDAVIGSRFRGTCYAAQIRQLFGDSRQFDTVPYARTMDLIWIDAGHDYECVLADSSRAEEMLAPGGIIAWHDFSRACPGVVRLVNEWAGTRGRTIRWASDTQVVYWDSGN